MVDNEEDRIWEVKRIPKKAQLLDVESSLDDSNTISPIWLETLSSSDLTSSVLGSSSSISDLAINQSDSYSAMEIELEQMKSLVKSGKENATKLESIIVNLEKKIKELQEENTKLRSYNQATKDTVELFNKQQFQLNIQTSANAMQTQSQQQTQSMELTIYRELIRRVDEVENEIKGEPTTYEKMQNLKDLRELLSELKNSGVDDINKGFFKKIVDSQIFKNLINSDNITKISSTLFELLNFIRNLNIT